MPSQPSCAGAYRTRAFLLVERVAEEVAELIMTRFAVPWIRIRLTKPGAVPQAKGVGVIIERARG